MERIILDEARFSLTIERLTYQLIEDFGDFKDTCIIGIQPEGCILASRIYQRLLEISKLSNIEYGKLDITFFRDDFRTRTKPLTPSSTQIDFLIDNKKVILVDDVLYTGRTINAALAALQYYGRADEIALVTMVDRCFNRELPIEANYTGISIDSRSSEAYVQVEWKEIQGADNVILFPQKQS